MVCYTKGTKTFVRIFFYIGRGPLQFENINGLSTRKFVDLKQLLLERF